MDWSPKKSIEKVESFGRTQFSKQNSNKNEKMINSIKYFVFIIMITIKMKTGFQIYIIIIKYNVQLTIQKILLLKII
jgi:hypothetical protein